MRHFSGEFEGMRLLMADELDLIAGGDGEDTDDVQEDRLTDCERNFLTQQLGIKGMPSNFLSQVVFKSGLDGNENTWTSLAWNGSDAAAVTQGNTIYVRPEYFESFSSFQNKAAFEEVFHASQFAQYGDDFYTLYGLSSIYGATFGSGAYDGNQFEINAKAFAHEMQGQKMSCNR